MWFGPINIEMYFFLYISDIRFLKFLQENLVALQQATDSFWSFQKCLGHLRLNILRKAWNSGHVISSEYARLDEEKGAFTLFLVPTTHRKLKVLGPSGYCRKHVRMLARQQNL
jgi:hypothetical protein